MEMPRVAVLGASGLIGDVVVADMRRRGVPVLAIARRFGAGKREGAPADRIETPFARLGAEALAQMLAGRAVEIVVNAVGVLQSGPSGSAETAHVEFAQRLVVALRAMDRPALLIHLYIPGADTGETEFSRTKRRAELAIEGSGLPYVLLRPGFVIGPTAYGGSALIRALAVLLLRLPREERARPLQVTAMSDVMGTVAWAAGAWAAGRREFAADSDVMSPEPTSVGEVVEALRRRLGGPRPVADFPRAFLGLGARLADALAVLGSAAPIRSTALAEMQRGVTGDSLGWRAQTGMAGKTLSQAMEAVSPGVQERWFARLYLLKAGVIATLSAFYGVSGLIALSAGFRAAEAELTARGFSATGATMFVIVTAALDLAVGAAIAVRRTCRIGLWTGLGLALAYLIGGTALAPALWGDPLGPFVKVFPTLMLLAVALAIHDDR